MSQSRYDDSTTKLIALFWKDSGRDKEGEMFYYRSWYAAAVDVIHSWYVPREARIKNADVIQAMVMQVSQNSLRKTIINKSK